MERERAGKLFSTYLRVRIRNLYGQKTPGWQHEICKLKTSKLAT